MLCCGLCVLPLNITDLCMPDGVQLPCRAPRGRGRRNRPRAEKEVAVRLERVLMADPATSRCQKPAAATAVASEPSFPRQARAIAAFTSPIPPAVTSARPKLSARPPAQWSWPSPAPPASARQEGGTGGVKPDTAGLALFCWFSFVLSIFCSTV